MKDLFFVLIANELHREFSNIENTPMPMLFTFCNYSTNIPDKNKKSNRKCNNWYIVSAQ